MNFFHTATVENAPLVLLAQGHAMQHKVETAPQPRHSLHQIFLYMQEYIYY